MKKNTRLLLIILVLIVVAIALFLGRRSTTFNETESRFAIDDTTSLTRFFLADKKGATVLISRDSAGGWRVNHTMKANKMIVESFLGVASQLAVESPVAEKAADRILKSMAANAVKVEIYQMKPAIDWFGLRLFVKERLTRTYYVGDVTSDNIGTYMLMEGSSQPFVVYQPGFRGFVQARYFTNATDWRDHTIFATPLEQIKSVGITYPEMPQQSFTITNNGDRTLTVAGSDGTPLSRFDTLGALAYLTAFNSVKFEAFLNDLDPHKRDSITQSQPLFVLSLTETSGTTTTMKAWRMEVGEANTQLYGNKFNMDRMYAMVGDENDFVMIQYFVFDKFMKGIADFAPKNKK